jgi:selenocysteine lyase/cysteine desulfurase
VTRMGREAGSGHTGGMTAEYESALARAVEHATDWLDSLPTRPVPARAGVAEVIKALGTELPDGPTAADEVIDLLGLPADCGVGFVTGATMSNFTCLAAARGFVLSQANWDVARDGLAGAPRVRVLAGAERHDTVDLALRYLGLGAPEVVAADEQGRIDAGALAAALASGPSGPTIVVLQAGNVHSGAFDPFGPAIAVAREHGAWVHVDGAFGLFAAASPRYRHLTAGYQAADSWTTDAHKTLNVPYDCGIAIVANQVALRADGGGHPANARRWHRLDVRLPLARRVRAAHLGQQLVHHGGRRAAQPGGVARCHQQCHQLSAMPGTRRRRGIVEDLR